MSMPWAFERSPYNCPRDGKALAMQLGQHADGGWNEQHHFCPHCDYVETRPMPHRTQTVLTVAEIIRRKTAHLDRGEGVQRWIGTMTDAELDELAERGEN